MENFRRRIRSRIRVMAGYNSILVILISRGLFHPTAGTTEAASGFMSGLNVGLVLFIQLGLTYLLVKYGRAIKDEEKLETFYIYENDERRKFINNQIGGVAINILLALFALGTVGAGFFNETVFFTLLASLLLTAFVKGILKIYFIRKV